MFSKKTAEKTLLKTLPDNSQMSATDQTVVRNMFRDAEATLGSNLSLPNGTDDLVRQSPAIVAAFHKALPDWIIAFLALDRDDIEDIIQRHSSASCANTALGKRLGRLLPSLRVVSVRVWSLASAFVDKVTVHWKGDIARRSNDMVSDADYSPKRLRMVLDETAKFNSLVRASARKATAGRVQNFVARCSNFESPMYDLALGYLRLIYLSVRSGNAQHQDVHELLKSVFIPKVLNAIHADLNLTRPQKDAELRDSASIRAKASDGSNLQRRFSLLEKYSDMLTEFLSETKYRLQVAVERPDGSTMVTEQEHLPVIYLFLLIAQTGTRSGPAKQKEASCFPCERGCGGQGVQGRLVQNKFQKG